MSKHFDLVDNLNKVVSILAGQDIEISTEQALVQEANIQINSLNVQIEELKKRKNLALQDYAEKEKELKYIALLKDSLLRSIELSRKSSIFLEEQKWHYQEKVQQWRRQQDDILTEHFHKFDTFKRTITADLPLYEKLEKLKAEEKRLLVNWKYKKSLVDNMKSIRKKNCEIKRQIYNADIVNFVKACKAYKENQTMFSEIKKLEELQSNLDSRYKELQKINAEKEVKESTNCLTELKELDEFDESPSANSTFPKHTIPPLLRKERYSLFKETSICETTQLVVRNYKMRTVLLKRKSSESSEFGLKPEKQRNIRPKVKILDVQTIKPEQEIKKLSHPKLPSKNVEEAKNKDKENDAKLQIKESQEEGEKKPPETFEMKSFETDWCTPKASQPVNTQERANIDVEINQGFDIENMTTDEHGGFDRTTNDVDNEAFFSLADDAVGEFVMSPAAITKDGESCFDPTSSDDFFKLY